MRKTYGDGTVVEGTPEEIRAYEEEQRGVAIIPMVAPRTDPFIPALPWTPPVGTPWTLNPQTPGIIKNNCDQQQSCLVEAFFRDNPKGACSIACPCPRCSPSYWVLGSTTGDLS